MEHHNSVSSIYSALEDVPLILAPQFSTLKPKKIDFNLERRIVAETERFRQENDRIAQIRAQKLQALREERIRKQKEEARKIAPGFLDTDQRILTPTLMYSSSRRTNQQLENVNNVLLFPSGGNKTDVENKIHTRSISDEMPTHVVERMKLTKDEDGNEESSNSWNSSNSIKDDISILIGSTQSLNVISSITFITTFPPLPQNLVNMHISPPNTYNIVSALNSMNIQQQQQLRTYSTPPLPHNVHERRSSSSQQHIVPSPPLPIKPPKEVISSSTTIPTTNPSPHIREVSEVNEVSELVKQFINMGFTKSQATDALEKYNNDLQKASNYLLDMQ
ncbi:664_t:CDS:2 [Diversispora eburnea]|uniref:664_t:CDS:1 n=1 Tax=Diversispora eburnea TaxID=1213867 RepID=A0A9N8Z0T8_9GLOM|nr:664_t:CDS:2 [Diversispora eburnea]